MSIKFPPWGRDLTSEYLEACEGVDPSAIERCISNGADPMAVDPVGRNALHTALKKQGRLPNLNVIRVFNAKISFFIGRGRLERKKAYILLDSKTF